MGSKYIVVVDGAVMGIGETSEEALERAGIGKLESLEERSIKVSEYPADRIPEKGVAYLCECTDELAAAIGQTDGVPHRGLGQPGFENGDSTSRFRVGKSVPGTCVALRFSLYIG